MEFEIGEQVNANQPALSLLTEGNLEVEVDISESDINKINVNDKVEITFDSLGEDKKFVGQVGFIEPAETVIQDVIYYKVEIYLADIASEYQTLIKPGMTTNIVITTAEKENVLIAPNRAIIDKNGSGKFLRLLVNEKLMEIPVSVGLKGDNGLVEIISDQVKAGDLAITFIKETTKE
jgi:multidrug efflux pump subunit AcrA (membrane-fusion protein)